jgi:hypothetical protein
MIDAGSPKGMDALNRQWKKLLDEAKDSIPTPNTTAALVEDLLAAGLVRGSNQTALATGGGGRFADPWIQWAMLADSTRIQRYEQALRKRMVKGWTTLDVGAGTGLLSHLALKTGAKHVYAIEETAIAATFERVMKRLHPTRFSAGEEPSHTLLAGNAADVIGSVSRIPIDLVISELFGHDPYCEGMIPTLRAVQQNLRPGFASIPERVTVKCQFATLGLPKGDAAEHDPLRERLGLWNQIRDTLTEQTQPGKEDQKAGSSLLFQRSFVAVEDWSTLSFAYPLRAGGFKRLGPEVTVHQTELGRIPPRSATTKQSSHTVRVPSLDSHAFLMMWFEADLCEGVRISSLPGSPDACPHWSPVILPLIKSPQPGLEARIECGLDPDECHLELALHAVTQAKAGDGQSVKQQRCAGR